MNIIRVFPSKTSFTPEDDYAFVGLPPFVIPGHDEVHISCTFTWDKEEAEFLAENWRARTDKKVIVGGGGVQLALRRFHSGNVCKRRGGIHIKGVQQQL